ncbi:MAG: phosphatase PAP2 family protein [Solirubrobacteraceae bacterium]
MVGLRRRLLTVTLAALGAVFAATLAVVIGDAQPVGFDASVADFVAAHRSPGLTSGFKVVTGLGSTVFLVPVAALVGLALRRVTQRWRPLLILAASLAGASTLSNLIKLAIGRARPADGLVDTISSAFPSGHATAAAAGWIAIAIVLGGVTASPWARRCIFAAAMLVVVIVGASRVYLGVHWSTDVLGGWALGGLWVATVVLAVSRRGH